MCSQADLHEIEYFASMPSTVSKRAGSWIACGMSSRSNGSRWWRAGCERPRHARPSPEARRNRVLPRSWRSPRGPTASASRPICILIASSHPEAGLPYRPVIRSGLTRSITRRWVHADRLPTDLGRWSIRRRSRPWRHAARRCALEMVNRVHPRTHRAWDPPNRFLFGAVRDVRQSRP